MPRIVIGSTALARWIPGHRTPSDLDVFTDSPAPGEDAYWHPKIGTWWLFPGTNRTASLHELYTIKISHSYWELPNGSWEKHIEDAMLMKRHGACLMPALHRLLYEVWRDRYGPKKVDLSKDTDGFFTDGVRRKYVHDTIHETVAYEDRPMYESVLKNPTTVTIDMEKVKALRFDRQIQLYREEVYATALERLLIPSGYEYSPRRAYAWALRRTITSLTKGWSAQFMAENYDTFRSPDIDYVRRHLDNSHKLRKLEVQCSTHTAFSALSNLTTTTTRMRNLSGPSSRTYSGKRSPSSGLGSGP